MIIERITASRLVPPRVIETPVPIDRVAPEIEYVHTIGSGERQVQEGVLGTLYVSYNDVEVDFYSPRDMIEFSQQSRLRLR